MIQANHRRWPWWALALVCLLVGVWISDDHTAAATLTRAGQTQPWAPNEARELVGTWHVAPDAAAAIEPACAGDATLHYHLLAARQLGYTLRCRTADARHHAARGLVLQAASSETDAAANPRAATAWRQVAHWLSLPRQHRLMIVRAADADIGLASVTLPGPDAPVIVLSRAYRPSAADTAAFQRHVSPDQAIARSPVPSSAWATQAARL